MNKQVENPTCTDAEALERQAERGWMLPYLIAMDTLMPVMAEPDPERRAALINEPSIGRWAYWLWIIEQNVLPPDPIPAIRFRNQPDPADAKQVQEWLKIPVSRYGHWFDRAWLDLVKWLLHGFGRPDLKDDVARIPKDVRAQWYRQVNLGVLLHSPCDWSAFVLQGGLQADRSKRSPWSHSTGFFATPMNICTTMAEMMMGIREPDPLNDRRVETVMDPCVGTGSMLLAASNHSLRLYGTDIVHDLCLCAELNGWLWMPWAVFMPDKTRAMLEARAEDERRWRAMRDIITGAGRGTLEIPTETPSPRLGIAHTPASPTSQALAEQRRESADAFYEAARKGELVQMGMF